MPNDLQPFPLAPFGGLDSRAIDDRLIDGSRLRGGQNIIPLDGEWWSRGGLDRITGLPRSFGTGGPAIKWTHVVDYEDTTYSAEVLRIRRYFICKYGVIQYNPATGYFVPWHVSTTYHTSVTVSAVAGSPYIECATGIGGLFLWDGTGTVYMVSAGSGTTYSLDRPWEGATNAAASMAAVALVNYSDSAQDVTDVAVFRHINNLAAGDLHSTSPAIAGPATYLVICFGPTNDDDPIAVRIDYSSAQDYVTDFFGDTSPISMTQPVVRPRFVRSVDERLIFGWTSDPDGKNPQVSWWYSAPGDMGTWHTGVKSTASTSGNAIGNFVTFTDSTDAITALEVAADRLTVHRTMSQYVLTFQPNGPFDFDSQTNVQGFGVQTGDHRAIIVANNVQYLLTQGGPAVWDGQTMRYLDPALCDLFLAFRDTSITSPPYTGHIGWHDPAQGRLGWFLKTGKQMGQAAENSLPWIVYDYRRDAWTVLLIPCTAGVYVCGAAAGHVMFTNGTVCTIPSPLYAGAVSDDHPDGISTVRIDQRAETPWMDFGMPTQKHLAFVELVLRAPHEQGEQAMTGADSSMSLTVEVATDYDEDTSTSFTTTVAQSDFPATGGLRAAPRVIKKVPFHKQGSLFRFSFTNEVSTGSRNPFRLSNAIAWFRPTGSRVKETPSGD